MISDKSNQIVALLGILLVVFSCFCSSGKKGLGLGLLFEWLLKFVRVIKFFFKVDQKIRFFLCFNS